MQADSPIVSITYEGKDITVDIAPFLTAFTFTDNSGGKADDISFTLMDRNGAWMNSWMPSKGDRIIASVVKRGNTSLMNLGAFEVDEVSYSMPPRIMTVKGVSCAVSGTLRWEKHNKAWENVTLREIAGGIAQSGKFKLFYNAPDYFLERREQAQTPDLPFLEALCGSFGLNLKVSDEKLIIYDPDALTDELASCALITPTDKRLISARFTSKSAGTFKRARVTYHHPVKNQTYVAECEDDSTEGSEKELEIYSRADSQEQAQQIAQGMLQSANSREITGTLTLTGSPEFIAGQTIELKEFGLFSGKYFLDKAEHSLSQGWTCSLSLKMSGGSKKAAKASKARKQGKTEKSGGIILADDSRGY